MKTLVLRTADDFVEIRSEIESLMLRCNAKDDILLSAGHFLVEADGTRCSRAVACWRGVELTGLLFTTDRPILNFQTGFAVGGNSSGRGLLLCQTDDENDVVQAGVEALFRNGIHSVHLRYVPTQKTRVKFPERKVSCMEGTIPGDQIMLSNSLEEFMTNLGKNTRRNIRYHTRKTLSDGISFDAAVNYDEFVVSRTRLNEAAAFKQSNVLIKRHDRLVNLYARSSIGGLRNAEGKLIALLYGFSHCKTYYLLSQWNDPTFEKMSLSLVLRAYTVKHLIATGHECLHFVGGTSLAFGRFCTPQRYCSLKVDRKTGPTAWLKWAMGNWCLRQADEGKRILVKMERIAGAFLHPSILSKRMPPGTSDCRINGIKCEAQQNAGIP